LTASMLQCRIDDGREAGVGIATIFLISVPGRRRTRVAALASRAAYRRQALVCACVVRTFQSGIERELTNFNALGLVNEGASWENAG